MRSTTRPSWAVFVDRIGDKRVLALVKAFLNAGVLCEDGSNGRRSQAHPKVGSSHRCWPTLPCPFSTSISQPNGKRSARRGPVPSVVVPGNQTMRLVRYADDFVVMIHGTRDDAEALWVEVAAVLAPMGLRLSEEKTRVCHIDEGFDFLGWHIQRRNWRGRSRQEAIYTYPSKKSLASIMGRSDR
jgi:RNA-directed DNA polymerase